MSKHGPEYLMTQKPIRDFLAIRGWTVFESTYIPGAVQYVQPGKPDLQCVYYLQKGLAAVMWIECKAPGYKPRCSCRPSYKQQTPSGRMATVRGKICRDCQQKRWAEAERAKGAVVIKVSEFCEFVAFYEANFGFVEKHRLGRK